MAVDPKVAQAGNKGGNRGGMPVGAKVKSGLSFAGDIITAFTTINRFRLASILVFFIGVYTTSIVIQMGHELPSTEVGSMLGQFYGNAFIGAILAEFLFTTLTSPLVTGKTKHPISILFLFINMGINSIVTLPLARGFVNSGAWSNINGFIGILSFTITGNRIDMGSGDVIVYTLGLILAFALCIGSEVLWHMGARREA